MYYANVQRVLALKAAVLHGLDRVAFGGRLQRKDVKPRVIADHHGIGHGNRTIMPVRSE